MKITHLFLLAVALLFLASTGFARRPKTRRECYQADGGCRRRKCGFPLLENGRCGFTRRCCVSKNNCRYNGQKRNGKRCDPLKD